MKVMSLDGVWMVCEWCVNGVCVHACICFMFVNNVSTSKPKVSANITQSTALSTESLSTISGDPECPRESRVTPRIPSVPENPKCLENLK